MRFSSVTVASLLFSAYMSTSLAADTANDSKYVSEVEEAMSEHVDATVPVHKFPALWTFELDDDYAETPELIAQMEEAFITSANEAHASADMKFYSAFIKSAVHEHLTDESDDKNRMLLEDEQGEYYYDGSDKGTMHAAAAAAAADPTGDETTRALRGSMWNRPANRKNGSTFRPNYTSLGGLGCNLCPNDDDATTMLAHPFELGTAFYSLEQGQSIRSDWQRRFCRKLRKIPSLEKARRCFIYLDLNHEEPDDNLEALASPVM